MMQHLARSKGQRGPAEQDVLNQIHSWYTMRLYMLYMAVVQVKGSLVSK